MPRFSHWALLGIVLTLSACNKPPPPPPPRAALSGTPGERLDHIVERYWDDQSELDPWFPWGGGATLSEQSLADSLAHERSTLASVSAVPRAALPADSRLTYDIFQREVELAIEGYTYPIELMPVNPFDGLPLRFATLAAERHAPYAAGHDDFQTLATNFGRWTNQAIVNMRDGMRRGYTLPRISVEKTLPVLAALGEDTQENVFYGALRTGAAAAAGAERDSVNAATTAVKDKILPAYRALHDFLQREYLPQARLSVGLSALPLGDLWYAYLVRRTTGGTISPAALHAQGLAEVERLRVRVRTLLTEAALTGTAQDFFDAVRHDPRYSYTANEDLLNAYQALKVQVAGAVPTMLPALPKVDFAIRGVPAFRAGVTAALWYRPRTANGAVPAVLYVNGAQRAALPTTAETAQYLREAVPGYHYLYELQRQRADLPRFRRLSGAPAFIEGWGLYAATLGEELGLYPDTEAKFGALLAQLSCAVGLVIDTGLHAQGWTRQRALDYLRAEVPIDDAAAALTVDRDIALPANALACTVGFLKIQELRSRAQQMLGEQFDLREFHTELIKDGAIPLSMLDAKMNAWIAARVATRAAAAPK